MKGRLLLFALFLLGLVFLTHAQNAKYELIRIPENHSKGFNYPYYLYIPDSIINNQSLRELTLLVAPNNTGTTNDTLMFHEEVVKKQILIWAKISNKLNTVLLMPVFPRTKAKQNIYTHALDRDALLSTRVAYERIDLQLIQMVKDAKSQLKIRDIRIDSKIWLTGFSASGMFANRFALLHPKLIKAVACGSPGGWPMAPIEKFEGEKLRYPMGTSDLKAIAGKEFDKTRAMKVPVFIYMGDLDNNDSVIFEDGYEEEDKVLIFKLFGESPIERWPVSERIYNQAQMNARFKLYSGVKHTINNDMIKDIAAFFRNNSD